MNNIWLKAKAGVMCFQLELYKQGRNEAGRNKIRKGERSFGSNKGKRKEAKDDKHVQEVVSSKYN